MVGDIKEVRGVRLQLAEGGRGQQRVPHQHEFVLLDTQQRRKQRQFRFTRLKNIIQELLRTCNSAAEIDAHPGRYVLGNPTLAITDKGLMHADDHGALLLDAQCSGRCVGVDLSNVGTRR